MSFFFFYDESGDLNKLQRSRRPTCRRSRDACGRLARDSRAAGGGAGLAGGRCHGGGVGGRVRRLRPLGQPRRRRGRRRLGDKIIDERRAYRGRGSPVAIVRVGGGLRGHGGCGKGAVGRRPSVRVAVGDGWPRSGQSGEWRAVRNGGGEGRQGGGDSQVHRSPVAL